MCLRHGAIGMRERPPARPLSPRGRCRDPLHDWCGMPGARIGRFGCRISGMDRCRKTRPDFEIRQTSMLVGRAAEAATKSSNSSPALLDNYPRSACDMLCMLSRRPLLYSPADVASVPRIGGPDRDRIRPRSAKYGPNFVRVGTSLDESGRHWPKLAGRHAASTHKLVRGIVVQRVCSEFGASVPRPVRRGVIGAIFECVLLPSAAARPRSLFSKRMELRHGLHLVFTCLGGEI